MFVTQVVMQAFRVVSSRQLLFTGRTIRLI